MRARRIDLDEVLHEAVAIRMGDTLLGALEAYSRHVEDIAGIRLPRAAIVRQLLVAELERRLEELGLLDEVCPECGGATVEDRIANTRKVRHAAECPHRPPRGPAIGESGNRA